MAFSRSLESQTVNKMIQIYCQAMHGSKKNQLCSECQELSDYAAERINKCPFKDKKPVCSVCPVHCYKPAMRDRIRQVMGYSGPKMIYKSPVLAIRYLYRKKFKSNVKV